MTVSDANIIHLPETESTNKWLAAQLPKKPKEFTVVYSDFQSAGKGQRGNYWESEKGENLLFSIVVYPHFLEASKQFLLSKAVALAIKEELECYAEGFCIKWPNDIYWHEKKICGTLIENNLQGSQVESSILGIGININQQQFFSDAPNPVSLRQITLKRYNLEELLLRFVHRIASYCNMLKQGYDEEIEQRYHHALFRRDGMHRYSDKEGEFMARIVGVKATGSLVLQDSTERIRAYQFKEVRIVNAIKN